MSVIEILLYENDYTLEYPYNDILQIIDTHLQMENFDLDLIHNSINSMNFQYGNYNINNLSHFCLYDTNSFIGDGLLTGKPIPNCYAYNINKVEYIKKNIPTIQYCTIGEPLFDQYIKQINSNLFNTIYSDRINYINKYSDYHKNMTVKLKLVADQFSYPKIINKKVTHLKFEGDYITFLEHLKTDTLGQKHLNKIVKTIDIIKKFKI